MCFTPPFLTHVSLYSPNDVSMLGHRLRRWPSIETALGECPVLADMVAVEMRIFRRWFIHRNLRPGGLLSHLTT